MLTRARRPGKRSGRWIAAGALAGLAAAGVVLGLALSGEPRTPGEQAPQPVAAALPVSSDTSAEQVDGGSSSFPAAAEIETSALAEPSEQPPAPPTTVENADERRTGDEEEVGEVHTASTQPAPAVQEPPGPPRVSERPDDPTSATTATFSFVSPAAGFYRCRLDATAPVRCTSPWRYSGLPVGAHSFAVQAINDAGPGDFTVFSWEIGP